MLFHARAYQITANLARGNPPAVFGQVHRRFGGPTVRASPADGEYDLLRGELVFVQQSVEPLATAEMIELQQLTLRRQLVDRRRLR
jgi:hypothetical protein